jgi:enterochelin esterase-like enzyme
MKKFTIITAFLMTANLLFAQYNKIDTSFYSESLHETKMVDIYFPPGYNVHPDWYYPVIYYLHAWGGDQNTMGQQMMTWTQYLINNGTINPVIIVGADNSPEPFNGSCYANSMLWGNYEDYMTTDLITWIESGFRAIPSRDSRAVMGLSMGAYGSFRFGILHKDKFKALAACAGPICFDTEIYLDTCRQQIILENQPGPPFFYDFNTDGDFTQAFFLFGGAASPDTNSPQTYINPQIVDYAFDENANFIDTIVSKIQELDIYQIIDQLTPGDSIGIFFGCGTQDEWMLYPSHLALKDKIEQLELPYEFFSFEGGHEMPGSFKERALIFIDSLLTPAGPYTGIDLQHQENQQVKLTCTPNPFTQNLTVHFELIENGNCELSIWSLVGRKIESIYTGYQNAGHHQVLFDASGLPEGLCFLRLHAGNETVTKKIIKIK